MLAEVRAYRLRELREQAGFTQAQLVERIGVWQRQVSKIERGDLDSAKIGTIAMATKNTCSWRPCVFSTGYQVELMPTAVDESA